MKQPTSVKVISWLIILSSVISFGMVFYLLWESYRELGYFLPEVIFSLVVAFVLSALLFLSAITMLRGKSWGRTLYIVLGCLTVIINFIDGGYTDKETIRSFIRLCIFGFFLYRPVVNAYFNAAKNNEVQE